MKTAIKISILDRLRSFYEDNLFEELSAEDVMAKYGCRRGSADNALSNLVREGLLERVSVWRVAEPQHAHALLSKIPSDAPAPSISAGMAGAGVLVARSPARP
jgi:hypothetical protein